MQRASLQHERARPFTHRKQFGFEPELANQLERRRFGIEDGVGSRFDRESAGVLRLNQSARARRRFPHAHPDSALRQFVGGSEPADPRANDRDRQRLVGHCCWRLATGYWQLVTGNWLLATGYWRLVTGYWLLATGYWHARAARAPARFR